MHIIYINRHEKFSLIDIEQNVLRNLIFGYHRLENGNVHINLSSGGVDPRDINQFPCSGFRFRYPSEDMSLGIIRHFNAVFKN